MDVESRVAQLETALLSLDTETARKLIHGWGPITEAIEALVVPSLERIGVGWEEGNVALSQVYMSGRICERLVTELLPVVIEKKVAHRMAIVVFEDHHSLGKRIVYSILRAAGYMLLDYGTMYQDALVDRVAADNLDILLISTLMLPSALRIKKLKAALDARGLSVRLVVGGAPFRMDPELWREVGADAMGRSASEALIIVADLLGGEEILCV